MYAYDVCMYDGDAGGVGMTRSTSLIGIVSNADVRSLPIDSWPDFSVSTETIRETGKTTADRQTARTDIDGVRSTEHVQWTDSQLGETITSQSGRSTHRGTSTAAATARDVTQRSASVYSLCSGDVPASAAGQLSDDASSPPSSPPPSPSPSQAPAAGQRQRSEHEVKVTSQSDADNCVYSTTRQSSPVDDTRAHQRHVITTHSSSSSSGGGGGGGNADGGGKSILPASSGEFLRPEDAAASQSRDNVRSPGPPRRQQNDGRTLRNRQSDSSEYEYRDKDDVDNKPQEHAVSSNRQLHVSFLYYINHSDKNL